TLINFNFTEESGYKDNTLVFDGVDDKLTIPELELDETAMTVMYDGNLYAYEDDKVIKVKRYSEDDSAELDGIEVGGRNLLQGTSDEWKDEDAGTSWYRQYFFKDTILEVGQTYTFSYIVEKTSEDEYPINVSLGMGTIAYQYDIPGTHYYNVPLGIKNSITFTFTQAMADRGFENRFAFRFRNERNPMTI